jgi:hypothetical protein
MEGKLLAGMGDIAATSLGTLYCHALETLLDNPILTDTKSVEITTELNKTLSSPGIPWRIPWSPVRLTGTMLSILPSAQKI